MTFFVREHSLAPKFKEFPSDNMHTINVIGGQA